MSDLSSTPSASTVYYVRREAQERRAAERAPDASVRRIHLQLAERYAVLASASPLVAV